MSSPDSLQAPRILPTLNSKSWVRYSIILTTILILSGISLLILALLGAILYGATSSATTIAGLSPFSVYMGIIQALFLGTTWASDLLEIDPQNALYINGFIGLIAWWTGLISLLCVLLGRRRISAQLCRLHQRVFIGCILFIGFGVIYSFTRTHVICVPEVSKRLLALSAEESAKMLYVRNLSGVGLSTSEVTHYEVYPPDDISKPSLEWLSDSRYFIVSRPDGTNALRVGVGPNSGGPRCRGLTARSVLPVSSPSR